ncbi:hypothetical protein KKD52_14015 [Myxococcota bacterium]|nr:hypothetical protein [Myxococcota bacterium]MBU1411228.1 hypothetical protein [Myxococcota bacterium]MBU1511471.1 hypothetical protein [Myxococcota bacterium]
MDINAFSKTPSCRHGWWLLAVLLLLPTPALAQSSTLVGPRARMGGRYDNIRMCVATPAGVNGGPAMDISAFFSWSVGQGTRLEFDLPVMRPILFGAAFRMLQFEPSVGLSFELARTPKSVLRAGPLAGISLHYGPDVDSESSGDGRTASFFALGPIGGANASLTFLRPRGRFDVQVGLTLYATRLVAVDDPANHKGFVLGGSLDIGLLFH